jgi:hypothetical protein
MRRPLIEAAHRPSRIVVRDDPTWREILPQLEDLKIEVIHQDKLPDLDRMLLDVAREEETR